MLIYLQMIESESDRSKFVQLYERYRGLMFHVANQIVHSETDAEDSVHEAFLAILKNLNKISDVECPKTRAYIAIIVERKAIDILRARSKVVPWNEEDAPCGVTIPPPGGALADALAKLSAQYREVLLLRYYHGYSVREIARVLQMRPSAVQKRIQRARDALQIQLEEEGEPV